MRTGDLILFRGTGPLSWLICWSAMLFGKRSPLFGGNGRAFSHIGMVVDSEDMTSDFRKEYNMRRCTLYMTEATSISRCHDVFGKKVNGVQIVKLKTKLEHYKGKCFHRAITPGPSKTDLLLFERNTRKFYSRTKSTPYEKKYRALIMSQLDFTNLQLKVDLTSQFCSEHVGFHHGSWGWIDVTCGEITPTDYGNGLALHERRKFGPIKRI